MVAEWSRAYYHDYVDNHGTIEQYPELYNKSSWMIKLQIHGLVEWFLIPACKLAFTWVNSMLISIKL